MLWRNCYKIAEGFRFEFSKAENLSTQHMGRLGVTLKQVLTRERAGGWRCHSDVIIV